MRLEIDRVRTHLCQLCTRSPGTCGSTDRIYGDAASGTNVLFCSKLRLNTRIRANLQALLAETNALQILQDVIGSPDPFMAIQADLDWPPQVFSAVKNILRDQT